MREILVEELGVAVIIRNSRTVVVEVVVVVDIVVVV